jgi:hypothetical protein
MGEVTGQRLRVEQNGIVVAQRRAAKVQWMLKSCFPRKSVLHPSVPFPVCF